MMRLSSNQTLFLKLVFPIFFVVLYGLLTLFFFVADTGPFPTTGWMKYSNAIFYLSIVLIMYKTVFQLQRIDCTADHFIVTNYKSAYRYTYDSIDSFREEKLFFFTLGIIEFKSSSAFGKRVVCLVDKRRLAQIREKFGVLM